NSRMCSNSSSLAMIGNVVFVKLRAKRIRLLKTMSLSGPSSCIHGLTASSIKCSKFIPHHLLSGQTLQVFVFSEHEFYPVFLLPAQMLLLESIYLIHFVKSRFPF